MDRTEQEANDERRSAIQRAQERHDRAHAEVERLEAELLRADDAFRVAQIDLIDAKNEERTRARVAQGIEGTSAPHTS